MAFFDVVAHSFELYYGLDWIALSFGVLGTWLLTNRNRLGFCASGLGCIAGFAASMMSGQFGFVLYNLILVAMMVRGFVQWGGAAAHPAE